MNQEILARTIIETLVNKFFRDVQEDPDRSIRNMIDLGINFARGRFQKEFFQILQEMLKNEQSAYYTLVKNAVQNVDQERLRTFGMNLGFYGCTIGANMIRENEDRWNFNIPWAFNIPYGLDGLAVPYVDKIISEGKALGSYVYILIQQGPLTEEHKNLLKIHDDCAFLLLSPAEDLMGDQAELLTQINNCLILVEDQPVYLSEVCDELRKLGLFYGVYTKNNDSEKVWSAENLERIANTKSSFYVLMPEQRYDFKEDPQQRELANEFRSQQEYPFLMIDYVSDIQKIDRIVSNDSCAVAFDKDGSVYTDTGKWKESPYNICHMSLFDILSKVTKKIET